MTGTPVGNFSFLLVLKILNLFFCTSLIGFQTKVMNFSPRLSNFAKVARGAASMARTSFSKLSIEELSFSTKNSINSEFPYS